MANTVSVTEKPVPSAVSEDAYVLGIQNNANGQQALYRLPLDMVRGDAVEIAQTEIDDIKAYLGYDDEDIVGLQVDYQNKTFTRLAGAKGKGTGALLDSYPMYGGRKRCTVADDGTITSYFGDSDYTEYGSMGQVMVYQPKFYYKVVPIAYDPIDTGIGHHLRKANYYVSSMPKTGFKLHPAFYDENGNEVEYILLSAYEGSLWHYGSSTGSNMYVPAGDGFYILDDAQIMNLSTDKLCSLPGAKPISGRTQNLIRASIEQLAQNRGAGWHCGLIKAESANQLLMMIELGTMNTQLVTTQGVVSIADNSSYNCSSFTGSTSDKGNASGGAASTTNMINGVITTETAPGKTALSYRGVENPWGNIWKFVNGINFYGDGNMGGGQPFICSDFTFAESKNTGNYVGAGFTISNASGYISAMGYSEDFDWLLLPSECNGASNLPVGDYTYVTPNLNGYRIALLGGNWYDGGGAGGFCWRAYGVGVPYRTISGRLVYVPKAN